MTVVDKAVDTVVAKAVDMAVDKEDTVAVNLVVVSFFSPILHNISLSLIIC